MKNLLLRLIAAHDVCRIVEGCRAIVYFLTNHGPDSHVLSFLTGLMSAVVFHYLLYRLELPSEAFIYAAF